MTDIKNRPTWIVRDCGVDFNDIKDWDKEINSLSTELSEEEKKSDFAKYYYREIAMPTHENLAAAELNNPLPKERAIRPEEFVQRMDSEEIEKVRSGYYKFDDGIAFSMTKIVMNGVTDEKMQYFNDNFIPEKDLYYKCWYPGMHMKHYIHGCIEDVGLGMELINFLAGYNIDDCSGVKNYKVKDPLFIAFNGGGGVSWPLHNRFKYPRYALQANWWRDLPDKSGRVLHMAFWYGMKWDNKKAVRAIGKDESVNIEIARSHMNHSIWEYTQAAYLINKFWEDNH